jgi:hypothetical protein
VLFNWNTSTAGHRQGIVGFPERKPQPRSNPNSAVSNNSTASCHTDVPCRSRASGKSVLLNIQKRFTTEYVYTFVIQRTYEQKVYTLTSQGSLFTFITPNVILIPVHPPPPGKNMKDMFGKYAHSLTSLTPSLCCYLPVIQIVNTNISWGLINKRATNDLKQITNKRRCLIDVNFLCNAHTTDENISNTNINK